VAEERVMKPPLKYFGSKWSIAPWIVERFPAHTCFVDLFGGSAAVLLQKPPSRVEVYNDLDQEVVNFFAVLREHGEELARQVSLTPFSRIEHQLSFEPGASAIERARRFVVRSWQTRGGYRRTGATSWWYVRAGEATPPATRWLAVPDRLIEAGSRLRGVHLECDDWQNVVQRFDAIDTLFYVDPPYLGITRSARYEYRHEMSKTCEHQQLIDVLSSVRGLVALSGYRSDLYDAALLDWRRFDTQSISQSGGAKNECLWLSPRCWSHGFQREMWT
jgi:DNA adenine methylase